ncbi:hypothetical protein MMC25_004503 [Agyrium rufum]|nr:hypothetical protein [Agyrium rufum]
MHRTDTTPNLELDYNECLHKIDVLCEEEKARQLRLRILLLENENDDLHTHLSQDDERIDDLEGWGQGLRSDLETVEAELQKANAELRIRVRETENLKTEVASLQSVSMDSTKLLTEKLALSRELAALHPEVEHLRSQAASHQSLLTEKLSLQRQLSAVQVELETEKRAAQRAVAKEGGRKAQDAQLEARIEELDAELTKERRQRQKLEREAQQNLSEFENRKTILESRLDAFRNKLRTTKEQLQERDQELANTRATHATELAAVMKKTNDVPANPRKRSIAHFDTDAAIGTPGPDPLAKKGRTSTSMVGDKSTFSITPFLNRTTSVAPESPPPSDGEGDEAVAAPSPSGKTKGKIATAGKSKKVGNTEPNKTGDMRKPKSINLAKTAAPKAPKQAGRKPRAVSELELVQEEEDEGNATPQSPAEHTAARVAPITKEPAMPNRMDFGEDTTFIKRKRKLLGGGSLGRTLFDEEEVGRGDLPAVGGAPSRRPLLLGKPNLLAKGKPVYSLGGATSGFGAFSPLKKDRKSAQAA